MTRIPPLSTLARTLLAGVASAFLFGACASPRREITSRSGETSIARGALPVSHSFSDVTCVDVTESNGTVHLLLGKPTGSDEKQLTFVHVRSDDGGATWSQPVAIPTSHAPPTKLHRGDDPQVAAEGNRLVALWTARGDGPYGSGPIATALSDDGGRTWRPGPSPTAQPLPGGATPARLRPAKTESSHKHSAGGGTGPGYRFPAAGAARDGFHVVWIHAIGDERSLRHATLPFGATAWSDATIIDQHICACCWNELKVNADGHLMALYRDQQPSDMALSISRDAGRTWHPAGRAGEFDWAFDGCPHIGGGLALLARDRLIATAWTGNGTATGAYVLRRDERGAWSAPVPLLAESPGRNTDAAACDSGAAIVWDGLADGGQVVYAAFSSDGAHWPPPRRLSPPGRNAAYPRVVGAGDHFVALWTTYRQDGGTSLHVHVLRARG